MSASDLSSAPPSRAPITGKTAVASGLSAAAGLALAMAVAAIYPDEGKVNRVYADVASIPTSCFGHREAPGTKLGTPRTDEQCTTLLAGDVERTEAGVIACTPALRDHPQQLAAATRLAFNIGTGAYCGSGTASAFNRADWRKGCDLMLAWDKAHVGGKVVQVPGLAARRQRERAMCLVGVA